MKNKRTEKEVHKEHGKGITRRMKNVTRSRIEWKSWIKERRRKGLKKEGKENRV